MRVFATAALVVAGVCLTTTTGAAQGSPWGVALEVAAARYGGTSLDTSTTLEPGAFRPHNPTVLALRVHRRLGRARLGVALARARTNVGISGGEVLVVTGDIRTTVYRAAVELGLPLWDTEHDGTFVASAGPLVEFWKIEPAVSESRTRFGGTASLAFEQRLSGSVGGVVRLTGTLTPSLFDPGELPAEFERRATWSLALGAGLVLGR